MLQLPYLGYFLLTTKCIYEYYLYSVFYLTSQFWYYCIQTEYESTDITITFSILWPSIWCSYLYRLAASSLLPFAIFIRSLTQHYSGRVSWAPAIAYVDVDMFCILVCGCSDVGWCRYTPAPLPSLPPKTHSFWANIKKWKMEQNVQKSHILRTEAHKHFYYIHTHTHTHDTNRAHFSSLIFFSSSTSFRCFFLLHSIARPLRRFRCPISPSLLLFISYFIYSKAFVPVGDIKIYKLKKISFKAL